MALGRQSSPRRRSAPAGGARPRRSSPKLVDGFAKQLVALAPAFWAAWATGLAGLRPGQPLDPEFRLVFRQTDTLLPMTDADGNEALILFEFQV